MRDSEGPAEVEFLAARGEKVDTATSVPLTHLQDPHDRDYRVPIPCRRGHAVELSIWPGQPSSSCDDADIPKSSIDSVITWHQPRPRPWKRDWKWSAPWLSTGCSRIEQHPGMRAQPRTDSVSNIAAIPTANPLLLVRMAVFGAMLRAILLVIRLPTNDKRARSSHIDDTIVAHCSCEDAWAKPPVSASDDLHEGRLGTTDEGLRTRDYGPGTRYLGLRQGTPRFRILRNQCAQIQRHVVGRILGGELSDTVAARALVNYHLERQRPMMAAFLDLLAIPHDNGLIRTKRSRNQTPTSSHEPPLSSPRSIRPTTCRCIWAH